MAPLEISGAGFASRAPVKVTVSWNTGKLQKTVRATPTGKVTASFAASLTILACRATTITAVGGNGFKATWRPGSKSCYAIAVPVSP
jgi:hypothetical protein